jgi:signal transduction histidine kinase
MKTVLIVDDNVNDRKLLRMILQHRELQVLEAANGQQALEVAAARSPDLIVSDALMPVMDGFQLLKRLQDNERLRLIPFIFYSASYTGEQEEALSRSLGARAFIVKPKEPDELWREICAALNGADVATVQSRPRVDETQFLQNYAKIVASKLEEKVSELEAVNRSLEDRIAAAVAELKQHEQMLIQQNRLAAMGELLDNISHQWRNPLNVIGLTVQEIQMECKSGSLDQTKLLEDSSKIMRSLNYLSTTIDDFQRALHTAPHKEEFSLREVVERTLALVAPLNVNDIDIELTVNSDAFINADPYYYSQVLMNILSNARDVLAQATDKKPRIHITISREGGRSVLALRDNGGGIPPEVLPHIFEPYFTTKFQGRGTGISLYMSKVIIEKQMGGSLTIHNVDHGVEVRIEV